MRVGAYFLSPYRLAQQVLCGLLGLLLLVVPLCAWPAMYLI